MVALVAERTRTGTRLRMLGAGTSTGMEPLARPGLATEVARVATPALAAFGPRADVLHLEAIPAASPWPGLLARHWPGARQELLHTFSTSPEPYVDLSPGMWEAWLETKSPHLRKRLRQVDRKLDRAGITARRTSSQTELVSDLEAFLALHAARWADHGGSGVLTPAVEGMLRAAAPRLLDEGRLELWSLETEERIVCSHLHLASPRTSTWWLQGYDDGFGNLDLTLAAMARAVRHGLESGRTRLILGEGDQPYKQRIADGSVELAWRVLPLPGPRLPIVLAGLQGRRARRAIGLRLGPERAARVRRALSRR